jgi:hypothetical protein
MISLYEGSVTIQRIHRRDSKDEDKLRRCTLIVVLNGPIVMKRFWVWFFSKPSEPLTPYSIILWWEKRRIPYNLIVGAIGIISLILFYEFIDLAHELKPGEDAVEPIAILFAPIFVNICYTAGWIVEILLNNIRHTGSAPIGPLLMKLGVGFSIVVALLPSTIWFVVWVVRSR